MTTALLDDAGEYRIDSAAHMHRRFGELETRFYPGGGRADVGKEARVVARVQAEKEGG